MSNQIFCIAADYNYSFYGAMWMWYYITEFCIRKWKHVITYDCVKSMRHWERILRAVRKLSWKDKVHSIKQNQLLLIHRSIQKHSCQLLFVYAPWKLIEHIKFMFFNLHKIISDVCLWIICIHIKNKMWVRSVYVMC